MTPLITTIRSPFTRSPFVGAGSSAISKPASEGGGGGGGGGSNSGEPIGLLLALTYP